MDAAVLGTDCWRCPKSLSSAQAAPLCSALIQRTRKCLQNEHFVRCCHSTHKLLFRRFPGVGGGGQQQFATQTLRVHLLGIEKSGSFGVLHVVSCRVYVCFACDIDDSEFGKQQESLGFAMFLAMARLFHFGPFVIIGTS